MPASRSLIALLIGTVAFFALWLFALKPSGHGSGSGSQGLGQYQSAINKAHQAVQTSNASNAASGNDGTASSSAASASSSAQTASSPAQPASKSHASSKTARPAAAGTGRHSPAAMARLGTVQHALGAHKAVAMLFYNPRAPDDVAVKHELASVPTRHGRVVKLTIPLNEASNFSAVTQQVPVNFSPTLVLIARNGQADEIVGFSDQFEIAHRVDDALAAR